MTIVHHPLFSFPSFSFILLPIQALVRWSSPLFSLRQSSAFFFVPFDLVKEGAPWFNSAFAEPYSPGGPKCYAWVSMFILDN